ncbi:V-type ATPase subunit [Metallosphaera tengchongensis]|uniref:V-type ATPase subunit n=1 Tax=Metallosphaera tengchongensis TaxID=1532350 RepID=A0A6N0NUF6_9CREN|nr:V-type ATPase subunit [Metallosphaera tengchongensis]QKQ99794.1 V-type ATPase subunit [Metallosphaera tengchongensis]
MSSTAAYISSVSRYFKSFTLTKGFFNELLSSKDWKEVLDILKEKGVIDEAPNSLDKAETLIKTRAIRQLQELYGLSNSLKLARDIVAGYIYRVTLDEFTYLTSCIWNKVSINLNRLIYLKNKVDQTPASLEELASILQGTIHGNAISFALSKSPKDLSQLNSLLEYFFIHYISTIVEGLKGDWKVSANNIMCTYKDYYSASLAVRQKIVEGVRCRLADDDIRDLATSKTPSEALNVMRRLYYAKSLDLADMYTALTSFYNLARKSARSGALGVFMGSPFNPIVAMGASELIKLDTEDVVTVLNGIKLKVPPESLKPSISIQLV